MLIEETVVWPIVYAFFHPEMRSSDVDEVGSIFEELLFGSLGIAKSSASDGAGRIFEDLSRYNGIPVSLVFEAYNVQYRNQYWRAQIDLVTGVSVGANIAVSVTNADGEAVEDGVLVLLGSTLRVTNGLALYSLLQFQKTLDNTEVSLTTPLGGHPVVGTLKFGEDLFV